MQETKGISLDDFGTGYSYYLCICAAIRLTVP
jgi:hypothetical protein